jgi:hypothetical protein
VMALGTIILIASIAIATAAEFIRRRGGSDNDDLKGFARDDLPVT